MENDVARWDADLHHDSVTRQTETLREVAARKNVRGIAVRCVELAGSHDDEVRLTAADALETSVLPLADEIAPLAMLLDNADDGEVAYWAATMLGRLGPVASAATPELERCLRESLYLPARERAAWAISRIGPKAAAAMPTLCDVASGSPPRLQRLALQAIDSVRGAAA